MTVFLVAALAFVALYALSWIVTCGLFWVVCACFDLVFTWSVATGVWIIFLVAKSIFSHHTTVKK